MSRADPSSLPQALDPFNLNFIFEAQSRVQSDISDLLSFMMAMMVQQTRRFPNHAL